MEKPLSEQERKRLHDMEEENRRLKAELERLSSMLKHQPPAPAQGKEPNKKPTESQSSSAATTEARGRTDVSAPAISEPTSPQKHFSPGLRLQPHFHGDKCVEVVATVVKNVKKKKKKQKDPPGKPNPKGKKKKPKKRKQPTVVAKLNPHEAFFRPVVTADIHLSEDEALRLKKSVKQYISKWLPVSEITQASTIEELLTEELKKGDYSNFYLVNLGAVVDKWLEWRNQLPNVEPYYAIKSNPDINIVRALAHLGAGFDCASSPELEEALAVGVPPRKIIFANPCKGKDHIKFAKEKGVELMTFDNTAEIDKIMAIFPAAKLVLRILADDSHSLCPFGTKFGASFEESKRLIEHCRSVNANLVGISFHVGSNCMNSIAYIETLKVVKQLFDEAQKYNYKLTMVDIGGGWPGTDDGHPTFPEIAQDIKPVLESLFAADVKLIAEPGRFFCTSCYTLAVTVNSKRERWVKPKVPEITVTDSDGNVSDSDAKHSATDIYHTNTLAHASASAPDVATVGKSDSKKALLAPPPAHPQFDEAPKREVMYYLSDGIYGSFNNIVFDHYTPHPMVLRDHSPSKDPHSVTAKADQLTRSCLFGPTCDSIDVICKEIMLPDLQIGDWLYFINMGAYTVASASHFNGFKPPNARYFISTAPLKKEPSSASPAASEGEKKDAK